VNNGWSGESTTSHVQYFTFLGNQVAKYETGPRRAARRANQIAEPNDDVRPFVLVRDTPIISL
jgi:hypothetical protein